MVELKNLDKQNRATFIAKEKYQQTSLFYSYFLHEFKCLHIFFFNEWKKGVCLCIYNCVLCECITQSAVLLDM